MRCLQEPHKLYPKNILQHPTLALNFRRGRGSADTVDGRRDSIPCRVGWEVYGRGVEDLLAWVASHVSEEDSGEDSGEVSGDER